MYEYLSKLASNVEAEQAWSGTEEWWKEAGPTGSAGEGWKEAGQTGSAEPSKRPGFWTK